jgi:hypothetical protein
VGLTSGLLGHLAGAVFDAAGQWVSAGASWILDQVVGVVSATTSPPIASPWFTDRLATMGAVAGALAVPLLCLAAVQAVLRQSPGLVVRLVVVQLPAAFLGTAAAVAVVQTGLEVTDVLSRQLLTGLGTTPGQALSPVSAAFGAAGGAAPSFAVLLAAIVVAVAGLTLWLEMAVRSAAVSVAVLFLPLVMAALLWPAVAHWCRRLGETLAALVLSKLVVVGALGLAVAALGHGLTGGPGSGGFSALVTGSALLVVAATCPFTLLRLIPAVEAGAVAQLEQARGHLRRAAGAPRRAAAEAYGLWQGMGGAGGGDLGPVGLLDEPGLDGPGSGGAEPGGAVPGGPPAGGGPDGAGPVAGGHGAARAAGGLGGGVPGSGRRQPGTGGGGRPPVGLGGTSPGGDRGAGLEAGGVDAGTGAEAGPGTDGGSRRLQDMSVDQLRPLVVEALTAGVPRRHLEEAVARRTSGLSAAEAYQPFLDGATDKAGGGAEPGGGGEPGTAAGPEGSRGSGEPGRPGGGPARPRGREGG